MIVVLSGITGVGKSYLKKHIINKLNFKNIVIVTTREKRKKERNGIDKFFVSEEEFRELEQSGKITVSFEFLGNKYAYFTKDLNSIENSITELHYSTISEFKKKAKNVIAIYIKPKNIEVAKKQLKLRGLPWKVEKQRLQEIKEQVLEFEKNENIKKEFDYIIYNDYTEKTLEKAIDLLEKELIEEESLCLKEG
ncbi:MAG: guanylate kinase [Clostridiales bacterium]|nr:guanylate kinase [Clostridiales bacterium]